MDGKKKKGFFLKKLKHKYRLVVYNDSTFEEVWFMRLSRLNLIAVLGTMTFLFTALLFVLIAYTSVRELIPGYPSGALQKTTVNNFKRLDSLEREMKIQDQYLENLHTILLGQEPNNFENEQDTNIVYHEIKFSSSKNDSLLRVEVEKEEQFNLAVTVKKEKRKTDFTNFYFFPPIKGLITNSLDISKNHYGTDVVSDPNAVVKATLNGTIIMSTWTLETGYVIHIQHDNNLISVYKHNAALLKEAGNNVKAGDAIAIIGNSGELSTGPHLHFELWHNGEPLDPENYIIF